MSGATDLDRFPLIMGAEDLAEVIGCSKDHAGRLIRAGFFDAAVIQIGPRKRISRPALARLLRDDPQGMAS